MNENHLSNRLTAVADQVPLNSRLADIGSDHAYLPIYLASLNRISFGIVGEISAGPLKNAENDIQKAGLADILLPRLADGLMAIHSGDDIDTITIAGMGGSLITSILDAGQDKLTNHPRLIMQPNVGANQIRQWLSKHHYQLINELILEEDNHVYEILVAEWTEKAVVYSDLELRFGPYLLKKHSAAFVNKWQEKQGRLQMALKQIQSAKKVPTDKVNKIKQELNLIQEVL